MLHSVTQLLIYGVKPNDHTASATHWWNSRELYRTLKM